MIARLPATENWGYRTITGLPPLFSRTPQALPEHNVALAFKVISGYKVPLLKFHARTHFEPLPCPQRSRIRPGLRRGR